MDLKYSPFGPRWLDRKWTGVCALAMDLKVKSVGGSEFGGGEVERIGGGGEFTNAERKILVLSCQKNKTKRRINLGRDGFTHNMLNDVPNNWNMLKLLGSSV
ncbi:CRS2-associated factor 1, mitochondrial [Linum perenne]